MHVRLSQPCWAVAAAVLCVAAVAQARPIRVALTEIEDDTASVADIVIGALTTKDIEIVSGKRVSRALARLGADPVLDTDQMSRLAAQLKVDAVIRCEFDVRTRRLHVKIVARSKVAERFSVAARDIESARFRKAVRSVMLTRLSEVVGADGTHRAVVASKKLREAKDGDEDAVERPADRPAERNEANHSDEPADDPERPSAYQVADDAADGDSARGARDGKIRKADRGGAEPGEPRRVRRASRGDDAAAGEADMAPPARRVSRRADEPGDVRAAGGDGEADTAPPARRVSRRADEPGDVRAAGDDGEPGEQAASTAPAMARRRSPAVAAVAVEREPEAEGSRRGASLPAIRIDVGASAIGRSLEFSSRAFAGAPPSYSNAPVVGARAAVEVYPGAFGGPSGWLTGFGVAAEYDQTLALTLRATGEMTVPLTITERSVSFGLRYRLAFGQRPTSPSLTIGVGYAARTFVLDRSRLMTAASIDLPDVDYRMLDPGLSLRVAIGQRVALTLAGRGLLGLSAGAIERPDQYGETTMFGVSAIAGIEIRVADRIAVHIAGEFSQLGLAFAGTGILARERDGDSATVDVGGATDRFYGAATTLAVAY